MVRVKSALTFLTALAVLAAPSAAAAQDSYKSHRKIWYALIGAAVVGGVTFALTNNNERGIGNCTDQTCVTAVTTAMGGLVGYLVGRDIDSKRERRFAAGPSLEYEFQNIPLQLVPDRMTAFPGGAAVVGLGGARIVMRDGTMTLHGRGVRGIEDVAVLPSSNILILSTPRSLLAFPVRDEHGQGTVIDERGGGTMEAIRDNLAVAGVDSLRLLALHMRDEVVDAETLAGFESFDYVADMAYSPFSGLTWVLTDDLLTAYNSDLEMVGELLLPAIGRSVRAHGSRLVVAAGTNGAFVVDATDPEDARVVGEFTGMRFAYAADLDGDLLYVAGGNEGVAVVDMSGSEPRVVGIAREVRFASDVIVAGESDVWILDREGRQVQIAEFGVRDGAGGGAGNAN